MKSYILKQLNKISQQTKVFNNNHIIGFFMTIIFIPFDIHLVILPFLYILVIVLWKIKKIKFLLLINLAANKIKNQKYNPKKVLNLLLKALKFHFNDDLTFIAIALAKQHNLAEKFLPKIILIDKTVPKKLKYFAKNTELIKDLEKHNLKLKTTFNKMLSTLEELYFNFKIEQLENDFITAKNSAYNLLDYLKLNKDKLQILETIADQYNKILENYNKTDIFNNQQVISELLKEFDKVQENE